MISLDDLEVVVAHGDGRRGLERGVFAVDAITPSPDDGLKAQAIAEAAARSLTTGKSETITY